MVEGPSFGAQKLVSWWYVQFQFYESPITECPRDRGLYEAKNEGRQTLSICRETLTRASANAYRAKMTCSGQALKIWRI